MASVISFRIDDEDREILQQYAEEYDATISWAARRAVKEFVAKIAKESEKHETRDYLLNEGNGIVGEDGTQSSVIISKSQESKV